VPSPVTQCRLVTQPESSPLPRPVAGGPKGEPGGIAGLGMSVAAPRPCGSGVRALTPGWADSPWEYEPVLLTEPRDALGLEVVAVASRKAGDVRHSRHADRLGLGHLLAELVEEVLKARG
jgi:hypothetical protein